MSTRYPTGPVKVIRAGDGRIVKSVQRSTPDPWDDPLLDDEYPFDDSDYEVYEHSFAKTAQPRTSPHFNLMN